MRVRQAFHRDRPVHGRALSSEAVPALGVEHHRDDPSIDVRSETAVQPDFRLTNLTPLLDGREIEKAERDGLLHLERVFPVEKDPGDVGLPELHARGNEIVYKVTH